MIITYLTASGIVATWFLQYFLALRQQSPVGFWVIILAPILFILVFDRLPRSIQARRQKQRAEIALEFVPSGTEYFRLDPYVKQTPADFLREDDAHKKVLEWVRRTKQPILFLSGASGAGKTSVLEGYVLPELREQGWRVVEINSFADPLRELENALKRRRGGRLLVVFDQFEGFVIVEGQPRAEQRQTFLTRARELRASPSPGLCLLFAFRTDYQSAVEALGLDEFRSRSNWMEIAPFQRGAARRFLEGAPQKPTTALVDRLLDGADALDDLPRLYRPVILNMVGLVLEGFDRELPIRPEYSNPTRTAAGARSVATTRLRARSF